MRTSNTESPLDKVMDLETAVDRFVFDGATVGIGGQNILRCAVAIVHEIIRQGKRSLTLVGCNLSLHMDLLVGAGLVNRCECGTGNLERFGVTFRFQAAIEEKRLEVEDYDHGTMLSRFAAGASGLPFLPVMNVRGSDLIHASSPRPHKFHVIANPWNAREDVLLVPALRPDVSIIHANLADRRGNLLILGPTSHDIEMIKASRATVVTCEKIVETRGIDGSSRGAIITHHFVSAVVEQPFGAYPTATHGEYTFDADHIREYQRCARAGGMAYDDYLQRNVRQCRDFEDYLRAAKVDSQRRAELRAGANHAGS